MTFHVLCRDCTDLEEVCEDGGEAHDLATDHVAEHEDHTATFKEVA